MPQGVEMSASDLAATLPSVAGAPSPSPFAAPASATNTLSFSAGPFKSEAAPAQQSTEDVEETSTEEVVEETSDDPASAEQSTDTQEDYSDIDAMFEKNKDIGEVLKDSKPAQQSTTEEVKVEETTTPTHTLTKNSKGKTVIARDYSDLDEPDRELAKNMSGAAFQRFKALTKEAKELTKLRQEYQEATKDKEAFKSALDHPDAWQLTPEYIHASNQWSESNNIVQHLEAQLANVQSGEKWEPLGFEPDGKGGQRLVRLAPQDPDKYALASVTRQLNEALMRKQLAEQNLTSLPTKFQEQRKEFTSGLTNLIQKAIDPLWNALDNNTQAKQFEESLLKQIPSLMRRSELSQPLARSLTLNWMLANKLKSLQASTQSKQVLATEQKLAGGVKSTVASRNGSSRVTTKDLYEDAEEHLARYGR